MGQTFSAVRPPRVLVLGLDGSGKTSLLRRLVQQDAALLPPSHGYQVTRVLYDGVQCELLDVGGSEELRRYWRMYFDGLSGVVFVIDSADKRRLEETGLELHRLLQSPTLSGIPLLILANKQDMIDALPSQKVVLGLNLGAVRDRDWHVQACSARDRRGVEEGFAWVLSQATKAAKRQQTRTWQLPTGTARRPT